MSRFWPLAILPITLAACAQGDQISRDTTPFDAIGKDETVTLLGTEPFWNITITGTRATYSSPEDIDGSEFAVARFAGNNGLGYSGELSGEPIQIAITPGACSDGMSDRKYPYTATVEWAGGLLNGCGYTGSQPFTGEDAL
jgi:uncharacterized membrane protein